MKSVWLIANNTFKEIIRDRILYGLVVFAVLLIGLSLALGQLSFTEQSKITIDFGLMGIQLSSVILSIFVGSTLVAREIEKRTIFTLLAHSVTRSQFLAAKLFGMMMVVGTVILCLSVILIGLFWLIETPITPIFWIALTGIFLESFILLSVTIFFGVFTSPFLAVSFALGVFVIGHWLDNLAYFAGKSESEEFRLFSRVVGSVFPNLERFNWRELVTYNEPLAMGTWIQAALHSASWVIVLIALSALIFHKKDFS